MRCTQQKHTMHILIPLGVRVGQTKCGFTKPVPREVLFLGRVHGIFY